MPAIKGYAPAKEGEIYYEIEGEGHPLVLVHSLLFNLRLWDDMAPALAQHFKTIRFDQRGYGQSRTADLSISDNDDILSLLEHLGIDKTFIMGLSMGSGIALEFTMRNPERVGALVMGAEAPIYSDEEMTPESEAIWEQFQGAALSGDYERAIELFAQVWVDGPVSPATPEVRARAREIMSDYQWGHYKERAAAQAAKEQAAEEPHTAEAESSEAEPAGPSWGEMVAAIQTPVLMVAGNRDQPGVPKAVEASRKVLPKGEGVIIEGAAHLIPLEKPAEFANVVIDFLERQEKAGA